MKKSLRVAVIRGGRSAEHEVSLRSAANVIAALKRSGHQVLPMTVNRAGRITRVDRERLFGRTVDVVFPVLHGPYGEDGTMQGLLTIADVPFVGPGVLGSAVGMDKDVAKRLLEYAGIPVAPYLALRLGESIPTRALRPFGFPLFVKPANMGSSAGVHKVLSHHALRRAVSDAFRYDHKILIEKMVRGRELECSVLGNEHRMVSVFGEIIPRHAFYSYEAKYEDPDGAALVIPANLTERQMKKGQQLAVRTCEVLELDGMSRVDMFLTPTGTWFVNEVNTIPGFTDISMYPKLWEASGVSYEPLVNTLLELAIARHRRDAKHSTKRL